MRSYTAARLAWSACVLSLALTLSSVVLLALNLSHPDVPVYSFWAENVLFSVGFSTVGAAMVPRMPSGNPIGWLFCSAGLLWALVHFSAEYAIYALLAEPGSLPAGAFVSWFFCWPPFLTLGHLVFLGLLFPTGRLQGDGWRWFAWFGALSTVVGAVLAAFSPGPNVAGLTAISNPFGIEGLPNVYAPVQAFMFALIAVAAASQLVRLFHARGVERLQIKWFAYAVSVGTVGIVLKYVISDPLGLVWLGRVGYALDLIGTAGIPISMGIAVTRYRLYDIDVVINRTLVYGSLTAALVAVYFGGVTLLQGALRALSGQESTLAVVASTLAIAALFNPLRRRIQDVVDRRFYRQKYDAAKTLENFSAKLRNETDLELLNAELLSVVWETVQPAHVSLWLRPSAERKPEADG